MVFKKNLSRKTNLKRKQEQTQSVWNLTISTFYLSFTFSYCSWTVFFGFSKASSQKKTSSASSIPFMSLDSSMLSDSLRFPSHGPLISNLLSFQGFQYTFIIVNIRNINLFAENHASGIKNKKISRAH